MTNHSREREAPVDEQFLDRWSPRAFSPQTLIEEQVRSLFEAARWAPSSGNIQPWIFLCAASPDDLVLFASLLNESNRRWAAMAPVLIYALSRRNRSSGKVNEWAKFDTGAAWMSLALQARKLGLFAHAMAGFDRQEAYKRLHVPETEYEIIAAIAVGYYGDKNSLPPDLQEREIPSPRKPLAEVFKMGKYL